MKKILYIIIGLLFIGILTGCDNTKFKEEYESLNGKENSHGLINRTITIDKDNPFVYSSSDEIANMIEAKKTFYVYFGDPLCPWCRSVLEKFVEVAKKNNIDKVYYVKLWDKDGNELFRSKYEVVDGNVIEHINDGLESYHKILESAESLLRDYTLTDKDGKTVGVGEKRTYGPTFIYYKDGVAMKYTEGRSNLQTEPRQELTEEILADEEALFNEFFNN